VAITRGAMEREQRQIRDAYGFALVMVLVGTLALVAAGTPIYSPLAAIAGLLQVSALILTLRVSGVPSVWSRVGAATAIMIFAAGIATLALLDDAGSAPVLFLWLLLTVMTIAAIARRLVTYGRVTLQLLMGLLVIYLLIGMSFGLVYQLVEVLGAPALAPEGQGISGAIYFSFITLATVGYGDVTPGSDLVRAFAIAESLIGQLYLVSVVSLAVSRLGAHASQDDMSEPTSAGPLMPKSERTETDQ